MQLTVKQTTEQPLLSRKEVKASVSFTGKTTPSNDEMRNEIAKLTKADAKVVVLKGLQSKYGSNEGELTAYVYSSEKEKDTYEILTKHQKKKIKEAEEAKKKAEEEAKKAAEEAKKKAEEEAAAAKEAAEKPAEEKAEEAPAAEAKAEEKPAE